MSNDNWISVKDRLPELKQNYWDAEDECYKSDVFINYIVYDGDGVFTALCGTSGFGNKFITHWQPLPEPPKVEKQEA